MTTQTTLWEALLVAAGSVLAVSPFAVGLIVGGYVAMRSQADGFYAIGVGLLAAGVVLVVGVVMIALFFA